MTPEIREIVRNIRIVAACIDSSSSADAVLKADAARIRHEVDLPALARCAKFITFLPREVRHEAEAYRAYKRRDHRQQLGDSAAWALIYLLRGDPPYPWLLDPPCDLPRRTPADVDRLVAEATRVAHQCIGKPWDAPPYRPSRTP